MILIFGASYGLLIACKLLLAGYNVKVICTQEEAEILNKDGFIVKLQGYLNKEITISSNELDGKIFAQTPDNMSIENIKLVFLAMQESQYFDVKIKNLMSKIADKKIPTISVMNMPPFTYLKNFNILEMDNIKNLYQSYEVWEKFDKNFFTHSSPDPQILKPEIKKINLINVRLASNFKISNFKDNASANLLENVCSKVNNSRLVKKNSKIRIPVKLNVFNNLFIPMTKWPMLITGNYRCLTETGIITIKEAVFKNLEESKQIYEDVLKLCLLLGANEEIMINFKTYLNAVEKLNSASSVAKAVESGNKNIERVDKLIFFLSKQTNINIFKLNEIIKLHDKKISYIK